MKMSVEDEDAAVAGLRELVHEEEKSGYADVPGTYRWALERGIEALEAQRRT